MTASSSSETQDIGAVCGGDDLRSEPEAAGCRKGGSGEKRYWTCIWLWRAPDRRGTIVHLLTVELLLRFVDGRLRGRSVVCHARMPSACPRDRYAHCYIPITQRPLMPPACPVDTYVLSYCSQERNDPPGKPVAFQIASQLFDIART